MHALSLDFTFVQDNATAQAKTSEPRRSDSVYSARRVLRPSNFGRRCCVSVLRFPRLCTSRVALRSSADIGKWPSVIFWTNEEEPRHRSGSLVLSILGEVISEKRDPVQAEPSEPPSMSKPPETALLSLSPSSLFLSKRMTRHWNYGEL